MGDRYLPYCVTCAKDLKGPEARSWSIGALQQVIEALPELLAFRAKMQQEYEIEIEFTRMGVDWADSRDWAEHAEHELSIRPGYQLEPMDWRPRRCAYCSNRTCGPEMWAEGRKCCPDCTHAPGP